jgi:hypothetical protein
LYRVYGDNAAQSQARNLLELGNLLDSVMVNFATMLTSVAGNATKEL